MSSNYQEQICHKFGKKSMLKRKTTIRSYPGCQRIFLENMVCKYTSINGVTALIEVLRCDVLIKIVMIFKASSVLNIHYPIDVIKMDFNLQ